MVSNHNCNIPNLSPYIQIFLPRSVLEKILSSNKIELDLKEENS